MRHFSSPPLEPPHFYIHGAPGSGKGFAFKEYYIRHIMFAQFILETYYPVPDELKKYLPKNRPEYDDVSWLLNDRRSF